MKRIRTLDGLRGVAILLVIAGHSWNAYGSDQGIWSWLAPIFANSSLGVRLFFVLSGYLITTLLMKEQAATGRISLPKFYARRALRVFPAFYLFIGCVLGLAVAGLISVSRFQLIAAATYTWNYMAVWYGPGPVEGHWFLGHLWTLSLEEQFYLFWPAAMLLMGNKKALTLAVALIGLMPLIRVISYFLFPGQRGYLGMMFHTAIDSIMTGCVLALLAGGVRFRSWISRVKWRIALPGVLAFVFVASPLLGRIFGGSYAITLGFTLDALAVAALVYHLIAHDPSSDIAGILNWPPLVFIGRLSYSWYLWQQLFLTQYNSTWSGEFPMSIVCSFLVAMACHYFVERPFLRLKTRFAAYGGGKAQPLPVAGSAR